MYFCRDYTLATSCLIFIVVITTLISYYKNDSKISKFNGKLHNDHLIIIIEVLLFLYYTLLSSLRIVIVLEGFLKLSIAPLWVDFPSFWHTGIPRIYKYIFAMRIMCSNIKSVESMHVEQINYRFMYKITLYAY